MKSYYTRPKCNYLVMYIMVKFNSTSSASIQYYHETGKENREDIGVI